MSQFSSLRGRGNYAYAGTVAADGALQAFIEARKRSPDYGRLAAAGKEIDSALKLSAMNIEKEIAEDALKNKALDKAENIADAALEFQDKRQRMAGKLAAAGQKLGYGIYKLGQKPLERQNSNNLIDLLTNQEQTLRTKAQEIRDGINSLPTTTNGIDIGNQQRTNQPGKVELASSSSPKGNTAMMLMDDLTADGYTPVQAAAIVGNAQYESGNFKAFEERVANRFGTKGAGYLQWTNTPQSKRRDSFEGFATNQGLDPSSYEASTGYMLHELKGGAGNHWTGGMSDQTFRSIDDLGTAVETFQDSYLRPAKSTANTQQRLENAQDILNQWTMLNN